MSKRRNRGLCILSERYIIVTSSLTSHAPFQSALLAAIAAQLFVFMKDPENLSETRSPAQTGLVMLSYMALVLNCSASITSLILIYRLAKLPLRIANSDKALFYDTSTSKGPLDILRECGIGFSWTLAMYHCENHMICQVNPALIANIGLFSLSAGITCILGQILIYIFLQESIAFKVTMSCVIAFTTLPALALMIEIIVWCL